MRLSTVPFGLSALIGLANAATGKIIVDDSEPGSINYLQAWGGPGCVECLAQPDPARAHGGTWHDATVTEALDAAGISFGFTFSFTGTLFEIYTIYIDDFDAVYITNTDFVVSIDNGPEVAIRRLKEDHGGLTYDNLAYRSSRLENTVHNVVVTLKAPSVMLLDYLAYEVEEPDTVSSSSSNESPPSGSSPSETSPSQSSAVQPASSSSSVESSNENSNILNGSNGNTNTTNTSGDKSTTPVGPIVGAVIGGLAAGILICMLILWYRRNSKSKNKQMEEAKAWPNLNLGNGFPAPDKQSPWDQGHSQLSTPQSAVPLQSQGRPDGLHSFAYMPDHGPSVASGSHYSATVLSDDRTADDATHLESDRPSSSALQAAGLAPAFQPAGMASEKSPLPLTPPLQRTLQAPDRSHIPLPLPPIPHRDYGHGSHYHGASISSAIAPPPYSPRRQDPSFQVP